MVVRFLYGPSPSLETLYSYVSEILLWWTFMFMMQMKLSIFDSSLGICYHDHTIKYDPKNQDLKVYAAATQDPSPSVRL